MAKCFFEPQRAEGVIAYAAGQNEQDPNRVQPFLDQTKEAAAALKEKNLFVPKPPKVHPVKQVDGILGLETLIGGKWYKVGDMIGDAKVVAIESTQVMIEWNGEKKGFAPLVAITSKPTPDPKVTVEKTSDADKDKSSAAPVRAEATTVTVAETAAEDDPLAWLGIELSPQVRAKLMEMWNSVPEEQRQKAKDEWNNMSESEKEEAIRSIEEQM